jgi:periplasmic divalent cation tolerance protein
MNYRNFASFTATTLRSSYLKYRCVNCPTAIISGLLFLPAFFLFSYRIFPSSQFSTSMSDTAANPSNQPINIINSTTHTVVLITVPSAESAKTLAHGIIERQLAACVNIIPQVTSVYRWEGKVNEDSEQLLVIKTESKLLKDLAAAVRELHPYTVPELISLPITAGSQAYLNWVTDSVKK